MQVINDLRKRPHWSYSSLNQLLNICSLQFFFERVARLEKAFTPLPLSFGSAFHRTLEWVAHMRRGGGQIKADETADLFHEVWKRQVAEDDNIAFGTTDAEECAQQGMALTRCFMENLDPEEEVIGVSEGFTVPVSDADGTTMETPLVGEIDCVVSKDNQTTLVDWKTSARRWSGDQADKNLQPTAYLYAYRQLKPGEDPSFRFDVVVKNRQPVLEKHTTRRTEDDYQRLGKLVHAAETIVRHEAYHPADTSYFCAGCPFQEPCRAWHRKQVKVYSTAA